MAFARAGVCHGYGFTNMDHRLISTIEVEADWGWGGVVITPGVIYRKKAGYYSSFGSDRFRVWHGGLGMMTYNGGGRWVLRPVPTACAYDKLGGDFGEMRKAKIEVPKEQWGFGVIWKFER